MKEELIKKVEEKNYNSIEKEKRESIEYIVQCIFMLVGIINITCASVLKENLPIIMGTVTIIATIIYLIKNIKEKEYETLDTMKIPENIVAIIIGTIIIFKKQNAIPFIAILWGLSGLKRGIKGFNVAIFNKVHNEKFILELIHASLETFFAILLIFDPFEKVEEHIILLGIEMIISSLKIAFKDKKYEEISD